MTQQVQVPGVGTLQFPDGMSQTDMAAAIQKNFPEIHTPAAPQQPAGSAPKTLADQQPSWMNTIAGALPPVGYGAHFATQAGASAVAGIRSLYDLATGTPLSEVDKANQRFIAANTYNPPAGSLSAATGAVMESPYNPVNWPGKAFDVLGQTINNATDPRTWSRRLDTGGGNPLLADKAGTVGYGPAATALPTTGTGSTWLGPVVSGVAQVGSSALPIARGVRGALTPTPPISAADALTQARMNSPQSTSAAAAAPSLTNVSLELRQAVSAAAQKTGGAINPDVLNRHIQADTLPVRMQLTEGQAAQDPVLISQEMNLRGKYTPLAERMNAQNNQLVANLQAIRDNVGPDVFSTNPAEHGDTLIAAYKAKDTAAQAEIAARYQALKDANGGQFPVDARALLDNATAQLHQNLLFDHAPRAVMSTLGRLADNGNMTFENFESLRTNLARIMRSSPDGNAIAAAGVIRNAMEQLPLAPGAAGLKPLADAARAAAKAQFDALAADPAYKAAVNDTVAPDRFVHRYVVSAPRDDVALMRQNLADNPTAIQTVGVATLDHLRDAARIRADGSGNFAQDGFNRALQNLAPKIRSLVGPKTAETLDNLGDVARYTQFQPRGSFVNNSNTAVAQLANYGAGALEGAANVAAKGIPVGTWGRSALQHLATGRAGRQSLAPGAGLARLNAATGPRPAGAAPVSGLMGTTTPQGLLGATETAPPATAQEWNRRSFFARR